MVYVKTGDEIEDHFRFYVRDGSQYDNYYPKFVEIHTYQERLNVDHVDEYVKGLSYAKEVAEAIMEIFESDGHMELYKLHNNKM